MEKDRRIPGDGSGSQPSAPPPSAPPSYEEAVANAMGVPSTGLPSTNPPYPIAQTGASIPMPYTPMAKQTTMPVPMLPQYPIPAGAASTQGFNADQNFVPPPEVRLIQHVAYALGPHAVKMMCPTCHADIKTTTISDHQRSAHMCCIVLCLLGCCLCSCLPYCMSAFMSVHHFCPNCKIYIGTWKG